ncbi:MAG: hypothetical protein GY906_06985 [bacterium]|nr:hypothetical protein [bacterium]
MKAINTLADAVDSTQWDTVEELWLEALELRPLPVDELLGIGESIGDGGKKGLRRTLLELLSEQLESNKNWSGAICALRDLVAATPKPSPELIKRLENALIQSRSGSPSLRQIVDTYQLANARKPHQLLESMERLIDFDIGTVVEVRGQGVGRVVDLNLQLENVKVDVGGRRPISVPFGAISNYLTRLSEGHFLRRKVETPDELAKQVKETPSDALRDLLTSIGGDVEVQRIKAALKGIVTPQAWTSWWAKARKHPCIVSSGSGSRLRYRAVESEESATRSLLEEYDSVSDRERLAIAKRIAAQNSEATDHAAERLVDSLAVLESEDPGLAWETSAFLLTRQATEAQARESQDRLVLDHPPLLLLGGIEDRLQRAAALKLIREELPDEWTGAWAQWLLSEPQSSNLNMIAAELDKHDSDALDGSLEVVFRNHTAHPAQFVWSCEAIIEDSAAAALKKRMTPSLLELIPDVLTKREFSAMRSRGKTMLEGGKVAIRIILEEASPQQATRFGARIARIDSVDPKRQSLVAQAVDQAQGATERPSKPLLVASRDAITARQKELKNLLDVEIPKTLKGINAAAAEGDLRENFEYHMLRDRQELQSARAAKLQRELGEVRVLEPGAADASSVNIGTIVHFETTPETDLQPVTILGIWDADVENRIFANESEFAQRMLGLEVGSELEIDNTSARVVRIEAWPGE